MESSIRQAVQNYLLTRIDSAISMVDLQIKSDLENVTAFELVSHSILGDEVRFLVKFLNGESFLRYGQVVAKVVILRKIVVAKRIIKSGQVIQPEDLKVVELNIFGKRGTFTESTDELVGKISKKMFREDEPIDLFYVQRPPDVKAGEVLTAVVEIGGVLVTAMVRVMQDGYFGETVKARNLSTGVLIQGILGRDYRIYVSGS